MYINDSDQNVDADLIGRRLRQGYPLIEQAVCVRLRDCRVSLRSNSAELLERLRCYFAHVLDDSAGASNIEIIAIERGIVDIGLDFTDWAREPGKTGRKDAIHDLADGRLVLKRRTGMLLLQHKNVCIAAGPCLEHDNQVVNFINSQFLDHLQRGGYALCHAAAVSRGRNGLALSGFSGGGKSTLMLRLLDEEDIRFVSNDRLLVRRSNDLTEAVGVPKLPRVNPGTVVHNPRLHPLIDAHTRERCLEMAPQELWTLEHKYDIDINALYGPGRIQHEIELRAFVVLNWTRDCTEPFNVAPVELSQRPAMLTAIMKSSGPFYSTPDGRFNRDDAPPDTPAYVEALHGVSIYIAGGSIDFEQLRSFCLNEILTPNGNA